MTDWNYIPRQRYCWVPIPPSVNGLFKTDWKSKRRYKSAEYAAWLKEAGWEINRQKLRAMYKIDKRDLKIKIVVGPRIPNADIDNRAKALLDVLTWMGVISDDKNVVELNIAWGETQSGKPGADVWIEIIDPPIPDAVIELSDKIAEATKPVDVTA